MVATVVVHQGRRGGTEPHGEHLGDHERRAADGQHLEWTASQGGPRVAEQRFARSENVQPWSGVKRGAPDWANARASSAWCSASRCTTNVSARSRAPAEPVARVTENDSAGGSTATDETLDAVNPTGPAAVAAVITVTPAGCSRNAALNDAMVAPVRAGTAGTIVGDGIRGTGIVAAAITRALLPVAGVRR